MTLTIHAALDGLALALIAAGLVMVLQRRLAAGILVVGAQGALLTAAAVAVAVGEPTHASQALIAAGLTAAVKVIAIPYVLFLVLARVTARREANPVLPTRLAVAVAAGLVLVAYRAAGSLAPSLATAAGAAGAAGSLPNVLPASLALMLLGLFLMVTRRSALMQVLGLITTENGMYLLALVATSGLPFAVELAILVDVLVGAILLGILAYRIERTFDHIDTDALRTLRF